MKAKLLTSAVIAAILPTAALASVGTERAFRQIKQPLNEGKYTETKQLDAKEISNVLGQSYAVTRAFYHVSIETENKTSFPESDHQGSGIGRPLDW